MSEIRTTSRTGGQKGMKDARFDLIPIGALRQLAEHYGRGAAKYTTYGECNCAANVTDRPTPVGSADTTTTSGSRDATPSTPRDKPEPSLHGTRDILSVGELRVPGTGRSKAPGPIAPSGSPGPSTTPTSPNRAASAEPPASGSTTTTPVANVGAESASEAASVTAATSDSATSKDGSPSTVTQHSPGCGSYLVLEDGGNQWRKGYEWSKSYAALQRHLTAWWDGEDIDAETGSSHLAAVAWHSFTLLTFIEEHPDFDDRFSTERRSA